MNRPIVYVQVSGGVAYICSSGDVEIAEIDWDNLNSGYGDDEGFVDDMKRVLEQIRPYATAGNNQLTFADGVRSLEERLAEIRPYATAGDNQQTFEDLVNELEIERGE